MFSAIVECGFAGSATLGGVRTMASLDAYADFGKSLFTGNVADQYLKKHGASGDILKDPSWVKDHPDTVANAVFDWYVLERIMDLFEIYFGCLGIFLFREEAQKLFPFHHEMIYFLFCFSFLFGTLKLLAFLLCLPFFLMP